MQLEAELQSSVLNAATFFGLICLESRHVAIVERQCKDRLFSKGILVISTFIKIGQGLAS
jgi:hypothetical protein